MCAFFICLCSFVSVALSLRDDTLFMFKKLKSCTSGFNSNMQRIGSHHSCPYEKKKLTKLKINYFLGSTGELSLQANHHLKIWRDK